MTVWGHLDEIDWSQYLEIPDELVQRAQAAFYRRFGAAAPVDNGEDLVMAVTGETEPDIALGFTVVQLLGHQLAGRRLPRDPDPADLELFGMAVAFVLGFRAKQAELEGAHDGA